MRLNITYKKVVDRIEFPDADKINKAALALRLGVTRSMVSGMIKTGIVPSRFIPSLKAIPLEEVMSRKGK